MNFHQLFRFSTHETLFPLPHITNWGLFPCSDTATKQKAAERWGMGTILHRIETCIAVALQTVSSCLINDFGFPYDYGNFAKYFNDSKICLSAQERKQREVFSAGSVRAEKQKYLINVPLEVKSSLEFCHEDVPGWYRGVVLKHMLHLSEYSEKSIANLLRESKIKESNPDLSKITSVHIRSTEKRSSENILPAQKATVFLLSPRDVEFLRFFFDIHIILHYLYLIA